MGKKNSKMKTILHLNEYCIVWAHFFSCCCNYNKIKVAIVNLKMKSSYPVKNKFQAFLFQIALTKLFLVQQNRGNKVPLKIKTLETIFPVDDQVLWMIRIR